MNKALFKVICRRRIRHHDNYGVYDEVWFEFINPFTNELLGGRYCCIDEPMDRADFIGYE